MREYLFTKQKSNAPPLLFFQIIFQFDDGTETTQYSSALNPSNNTWYHIAFTKDSTHFRGYFDGVRVLEYPTTGSLRSTPGVTTRILGWQKLDNLPYLDTFYQDYRVYNGVPKYTGSSYTPRPSMIIKV